MEPPATVSLFRSEALAEQRSPRVAAQPLLGPARWADGALAVLVLGTLAACVLMARLSIPVTSAGTAYLGVSPDPHTLVVVFGSPASRGSGRLMAIDLGGLSLSARRMRPADEGALGLPHAPSEQVAVLGLSEAEARVLSSTTSRRLAVTLRWEGRPLRTLLR
jgi:hypothetical protein